MIITVTLNPSLDRTLAVAQLLRGEVLRADETLEDPGGKGVNVTRFLTAAGTASIAVLPAGGSIGRGLVALLEDQGIPHLAIAIAGRTRANVAVVEPDGTTTKLNEPGPVLTSVEIEALIAAVADLTSLDDWVVVAGSLPPDLDATIITGLAEVARSAGAKFALDASGPALADGLAARPDLIKPNAEELGEILGTDLTSMDEVLAGCHEARRRGADAVICSLGGDGAVLVDSVGTWLATGPAVDVQSTVGAGDCLLAGFLHGGGSGPDALRTGVAWATAAVQTPGTGVPPVALIDPSAVEVTAIEPAAV
ncbi:MAG: 1-phosphofructokinase [Actinomycetota bacterium]|nr:1-phosphofructokinase [Actinomycetota bacterium]